jgi:predicted GNAT family acetyltransferase
MPITYTKSAEGVNWPKLRDDLVKDHFHNGRTAEELARSFANSYAMAFAWTEGRVIGKARALSDGVCNAYVVDVWTHSAFRRRGIARRVMSLLEEELEGQHIYLFTDDAEVFYDCLGYKRRGVGLEKVVGTWLKRA